MLNFIRMTAYQIIEEKIRYNQWANKAISKWLQEQKAELMYRTVLSGFPSLNKMLHHLMEAEVYYFSLLAGVEARYYKNLSTEEILVQLSEVNEQLFQWYFQEKPEVVSSIVSIKRSPFEERYTVASLITHLVNHSTYHRGQLVAMRHQLGISTSPKTDYYRMFIQA